MRIRDHARSCHHECPWSLPTHEDGHPGPPLIEGYGFGKALVSAWSMFCPLREMFCSLSRCALVQTDDAFMVELPRRSTLVGCWGRCREDQLRGDVIHPDDCPHCLLI